MSDLVFREGFWVRDDNAEQDLVVVRDVVHDDAYRTTLLSPDAFSVVVDIGVSAAVSCGAKIAGWLEPKRAR